MKITKVKSELWNIAQAYPTLQGLLQKELPNGTTVGNHWATLLENCNEAIFEDVCDEYASLKRSLPDPTDQLCYVIKQEVADRYAKDMEKLDQHVKYLSKKPTNAMAFVANQRVGHVAIELGKMVRAGNLSQEDNDARMEELMAFDRGDVQNPPDWMAEFNMQNG